LLLIAVIVAVNAQAETAQVFVSARNGADGGRCTVTLPCRTVSYALTQVQPGGQALIIDSGENRTEKCQAGTQDLPRSIYFSCPAFSFFHLLLHTLLLPNTSYLRSVSELEISQ
jgi:hypothetical protein